LSISAINPGESTLGAIHRLRLFLLGADLGNYGLENRLDEILTARILGILRKDERNPNDMPHRSEIYAFGFLGPCCTSLGGGRDRIKNQYPGLVVLTQFKEEFGTLALQFEGIDLR